MPFKIYADFEYNVKRFRSSEKDDNTSYTEKIKIIFLSFFVTQFFVLMINLANHSCSLQKKKCNFLIY